MKSVGADILFFAFGVKYSLCLLCRTVESVFRQIGGGVGVSVGKLSSCQFVGVGGCPLPLNGSLHWGLSTTINEIKEASQLSETPSRKLCLTAHSILSRGEKAHPLIFSAPNERDS